MWSFELSTPQHHVTLIYFSQHFYFELWHLVSSHLNAYVQGIFCVQQNFTIFLSGNFLNFEYARSHSVCEILKVPTIFFFFLVSSLVNLRPPVCNGQW